MLPICYLSIKIEPDFQLKYLANQTSEEKGLMMKEIRLALTKS